MKMMVMMMLKSCSEEDCGDVDVTDADADER